MLIPFNRNLNYINKINGKYLATVVNDLLRSDDNFNGYLYVVGKTSYGYIFIKKGKVINKISFFSGAVDEIAHRIDFSHIAEQNEVDLYINVTDSEVVDYLYQYFFSYIRLYAPFNELEIGMVIRNLAESKFCGTLAFQHGYVLNSALFNEGKFSLFLYYHPDTKTYASETGEEVFKQYLHSLSTLNPMVIMKQHGDKVKRDHHSDMFVMQKDVLVTVLLCYFDVFDIVVEIMTDFTSPEHTADEIEAVMKQLREKYAPLYKKLFYSIERKKVNWREILYDRKYVPANYRYEHYHLYMDELFRMLLSALKESIGAESVKIFAKKLKEYINRYDDKEEREVKKLFYRLDKLVGH